MFKILVVCTANICRSPVAEKILGSLLSDREVLVSSCGTRAIAGQLADPTMSQLALQRGWGGMTEFRSRPLMSATAAGQDLVLCMEQQHIEQVLAINPILQGRVKRFGHWENLDISDPVGKKENHYLSCITSLEEASHSWKENLTEMALI